MTKMNVRFGFMLLLPIVVIGDAEPASAEIVTVNFSGSGASGYFQYDSTLTDTKQGLFVFTGSALLHNICYTVSAAPCAFYETTSCEPYIILTSGLDRKLFQLDVTAPNTGSTSQLTIKLATNAQLSLTKLPTCGTSGSPVFVASPTNGASVLIVTVSGGGTTTYNLTSVSCIPPDSDAVRSPHSRAGHGDKKTGSPASRMCRSKTSRAWSS